MGAINGVGRFFSFLHYLIFYSPIYDLLYYNFLILIIFSVVKRVSHKGGD